MVWMSALHGGQWIETQLWTQWSGNSWWQSKPHLSPLKVPVWLELHICWLPNVTQSCLTRLVMTSLPSFQSAFCLCYPLQSSQSTWWWARMGCWSSLTKKREGIFSEMRSELSTVCNGTYPSPEGESLNCGCFSPMWGEKMQDGLRQGKRRGLFLSAVESKHIWKCGDDGEKQALPLVGKLSHSLPCSLTTGLESRHSPPGALGPPFAHTAPLCGSLKDALSRHPFLPAHAAPFQNRELSEQSRGCISSVTHFLSRVPLYDEQTLHPDMSAREITHTVSDLRY